MGKIQPGLTFISTTGSARCSFKLGARVSVTEKLHLSKSLQEMRKLWRCLREKHSRQKVCPLQRLAGCSVPGVFSTQQESLCGWSRVSKVGSNRLETGWGWRAEIFKDFVPTVRTMAFTFSEMGRWCIVLSRAATPSDLGLTRSLWSGCFRIHRRRQDGSTETS